MYVDWIAATEQARVNDQKKVCDTRENKREAWNMILSFNAWFSRQHEHAKFSNSFLLRNRAYRDKFYFPRVEQYTSNVPLTYFRPFSRKLAACEYFFSRKYASDEKNFTLTRFLLLSSQRISP